MRFQVLASGSPARSKIAFKCENRKTGSCGGIGNDGDKDDDDDDAPFSTFYLRHGF